MLRNSWGWGGVGWDDNIRCTWTHVRCYATVGVGVGWDGMIAFVAHEHMFDATQQLGLGLGWGGMGWSHSLHLHTCWMLRNWSGMITFLALAHMLDATQLVGDDNIPCTCTHVGRQSPATAHVDQLAARRLLKRPGLLTVMQSMATYRAARVNALGHAPADFLSLNNDSKWIYEWRHGRGEKKTNEDP